MSSRLQHPVRNLQSLAIAPSEDGKGVCILEQDDDDDLIQETLTASGYGRRQCVVRNAKPGTSAVYLVNDEERLVFYLDENGCLCYSQYDAEEDEWSEEEMEELCDSISIHPDSRLSGFCRDGEIRLVYQTPSLKFAVLVRQDDEWVVKEEVPVKASLGAPHYSLDAGDSMHLFYARKDGQLGRCIESDGQLHFTDRIIEGSQFDSPISRFLVLPTDQEEAVDLGVIDGKKLIPTTKEECAIIITCSLMIGNLLFGYPFGLGGGFGCQTRGRRNKGRGYQRPHGQPQYQQPQYPQPQYPQPPTQSPGYPQPPPQGAY
ncbi:hypothetical protein BO71DRAFT_487364 [Aspergillus ellipticus CBS 707.79]|uniref:Fucose-specific lectin n=1 Tax=Aspergillus ellipticus CBS 707.79 TaxID=1448320 RepID=A0A319EGV9_9EURO|nr:hypothetical protein BO71DRAFT_487364 [Aspergillus ellipticus CBS 707.79]